jgi:hypothetical protein
MHLVLPFAAPVSDGGRQALRTLALPRLAEWLRGARQTGRDDGDEQSLSPPHERALARARGWSGGEGLLPFAAEAAAADGIAVGDLAWGLLTPVHWHLGTEQLSLIDPAGLMLDEAASRTLFDAVAPLFTSEGFAARFGAASRWYIAQGSLAGLPTASIDRVIGRNVDRWLLAGTKGRLLRRLQNEVQMLLHSHPLNAEREARGLLAVNSFWLSGCGVAQPKTGDATVDTRLRGAALAEDWAAWCKAWDTLDAAWPRDLSRLTLCGERSSASFEPGPRGGFMNALRSLATRQPDPRTLLDSL